jgi:hypothetical protein
MIGLELASGLKGENQLVSGKCLILQFNYMWSIIEYYVVFILANISGNQRTIWHI